jgi:tripartite-type tricarboxylate transporter receptor subunit TctC
LTTIERHSIVALHCAACMLYAMAAQAFAADATTYPERPIRILVSTSAGSANDALARAVGQRFTEAWGKQVVVDNRPGAGGIISHELAARAAPDGHTLLMGASAGLVINPLLTKVPYDTVRDFAPVSLATINPQMLVSHPGLGATSVEQLVAIARARPGQLNCASPGTGTSNHLACEQLKTMTGTSIVHVPYKALASALPDLLSGQVELLFNAMPAVYPLAKAGKLRALGTGGRKRTAAAPEVPAIAETIPGFEAYSWFALVAPRATPPAIVAKLNAEMVRMFSEPAFAQRFIDQGSEPQPGTPAELASFMLNETERLTKLLRTIGLRK